MAPMRSLGGHSKCSGRSLTDRTFFARSHCAAGVCFDRIPDGADLFLVGCYAVFQLIQGVLQLLDQFAMKVFPASRSALSHQVGD